MAGTPFSQQVLKPTNAAKKLGVYLPATPPEFQEHGITRAELEKLEEQPPEWLVELRRNGPHPRPVVAGRLGISIAGLARGGITDPLTTDQINELRDDPPAWLVRERETAAKVRAEEERVAAEAKRAENR
ncbi:hypothetical protein BCE75_10692 [Isoptericola sp. CG 20/1183]|uniref:Uncharacterized protein n=1 Tax=Isoptericola halotolerans TaxID=300560 RepID=A0ABX5EDJ1_9MICO|nr:MULTISPECIES: DUF5997 family protein [Isoptericola]MCK0117858.1 DUF5997 family protein [Isoptericola sp. S6320L]PRZ06467.1 hypothetical protein BCL65_106142 [Isoptericola halotolerans]PRZ06727.1 hypothetical protein BCE75_10692 [Isoptericola sp. CG 20/1183]